MSRLFRLPKSEYVARLEKLRTIMDRQGLNGVLLTNANSFTYFTGFFYIATERPAALAVTKDRGIVFFGPVMEREHLHTQTGLVESITSYPDYPGETHPAKLFGEWVKGLKLANKVGTDGSTSFSSYWGYRGPSWSELMPETKFVSLADEIYSMRQIKSFNEQELIRESVRWGNLAHQLLQEYIRPGLHDFEVAARASLDASLAAKKTLGPEFKGRRSGTLPVNAGFRGQIGEHSVYPHSISVERPIRQGDILGSGASADIDGYHSEVERNLFVGKPTGEITRYHKLMLEMQDKALDALKPNGKCSDVDRAVQTFAIENGLMQYLLHHSGHAIGLEGHEAPFLDVGDDTVVKPGMVFTVEPGLYVPKLGGFRHSDTILVREDSIEVLSYYARDTDSLTVS